MATASKRIKSLFIKHLTLCRAAETLIGIGEQAHAEGDVERLKYVGGALLRLSEGGLYSDASAFYTALALNRSQASRAQAEAVFEGIASTGSPLYRAKALLALGTNYISLRADEKSAQAYYTDAERVNPDDSLVLFMARFQRAVLASLAGAHRRALTEFEALRPLAESAARRHSFYGAAYGNSLAVVLVGVGSYSEAERLARAAASSPYARPEFQQTLGDIAARREANARRQRLAEEKRKGDLRREIQSLVIVPDPDLWTAAGLERVRDSAWVILAEGL